MFSRKFKIGKFELSEKSEPFIIAEISANHNNDIERAKQLVREAAKSGAQAVKFQTYTPDSLTLDSRSEDFMVRGGIWDGSSLYDIYKQGALPYEWHEELFDLARSLGLAVLSTPFDEAAVDFLVELNVDALKIASFELCHIPLIQKAALAGLPIIMSTGMGSLEEVREALDALVTNSAKNVVLLHCISSYPASPETFNLPRLSTLKKEFGTLVGLSDHCVENHVALSSVAMGAVVIEKHFTLDRNGGGLDDSFSIMPDELTDLRRLSSQIKSAMTKNEDKPEDQASKKYRRSIFASKPIRKGEIFTQDNIRVVRPGNGLHPRYYYALLGSSAESDYGFAEPIKISELKDEVIKK